MPTVEERAAPALGLLNSGRLHTEDKARRLSRLLGIELEKLFKEEDFEAIALVLRTLALRMTGRFR